MIIFKIMQYGLVALSFAIFIPASILDIKYREVPLWIWYIGSKIGVIISIISFSFFYFATTLAIYYAISLFSILGILVANLLGHIGAGDLWASIFLALTLPINPFGGFLPPILLVLLFSAILDMLTRMILTLNECRKSRNIGFKCLFSAPVKAKDLIISKKFRWWFASNTTKDISTDDPYQTVFEETKGDLNKIIWAQPGLPFILFMLISLPIALVLGMII